METHRKHKSLSCLEGKLLFFYEGVSYWWLCCESVICSQTEITLNQLHALLASRWPFGYFHLKCFHSYDRLDWISHRFTRLHTNMHVQVCVCAWLWGVADPDCRWMSRLILSHGHWSSIIHEINAEAQTSLIQENLSPLRLFPSILPPRHFSVDYFPFTLLFSAEIELWVVNMKTESVHLKGWQAVRDSERETPINDQASANLAISWSLIHYDKHRWFYSSSKSRLRTLNHHFYASLTGVV